MRMEDFDGVCNLLRSAYRTVSYLDGDESMDLFFNALNRYDSRDVWKAVRKVVQESTFVPSIAEIIRETENAERLRLSDERKNHVNQAWSESVKCPKCNDAGFVMIRREDGTDSIRPCNCDTGREKFPWAFMDDEEWKNTVEEQRRKGKYMSMDRPGEPSSFFEERCGGIVELTPGNRPPSRSQNWKKAKTATEKPKNGAYIDFSGLLEEKPV